MFGRKFIIRENAESKLPNEKDANWYRSVDILINYSWNHLIVWKQMGQKNKVTNYSLANLINIYYKLNIYINIYI